MWERYTREQKEEIIKEQLDYVENEIKRLSDLREILEAEQLRLYLQ